MAVKIRLARRGRKKYAMYDVVVADARAPRDGKFIEKLGTYNPNTVPASITLDNDRAFYWVMTGAQPTDTVRAMLSYRGIMFRKHLQVGVNKGAITQEEADKRFDEWKQQKDTKIANRIEGLEKAKADEAKARLEAEAKVNEARAEALKKKQADLEAATKVEAGEAETSEADAEETQTTEEASTEETQTEE